LVWVLLIYGQEEGVWGLRVKATLDSKEWSGGALMERSEIEKKLNEMVKELGGAVDPQSMKLVMMAKQARESHAKLRKSLDGLQESMDYLRICIKYQTFDLEATRRENAYLKKILEDKQYKEG
jgi:hypothetical protein